jgi:hypothetical protein
MGMAFWWGMLGAFAVLFVLVWIGARMVAGKGDPSAQREDTPLIPGPNPYDKDGDPFF